MAELQATLDELDQFLRTARPELYRRLRPGLSTDEIDQLAESLQPYHLPSDLVALYRWHDGWKTFLDGDYCLLLPDAGFDSLGEAIAQYRAWWETLGADGWHPLWFPCFGDQSGELVVLQLEPDRPAGGVLSFHKEYELHTSYDSVAALFATTLECWRTGLLPPAVPSSFPREILKVLARNNPLSRTPDGTPRQELSRGSTTGWPAVWKEVLGIAPTAPAADELVVTIAEFLDDPGSGRPVRAEVAGWGGTSDAFVATATDATGSVRVLLTRDGTVSFREFAGGERFELWLAPIADRELVDELAADLRHIAELPAVAYLATRIVPL